MSPFPAWLADSHSGDDLLEAIRRTNATKPESKHTHPDMCERCGGQGCDQCRYCDCCDCCYTPEYVRSSVKNWRPPSC